MIPAKLTKAEMKKVQELAIRAFQAVDCSGLARVDFLMDPKSRKIYVNEINTMPGFTAISMYPKLWAATGMSYPELIDRLSSWASSGTRTRRGTSTAGRKRVRCLILVTCPLVRVPAKARLAVVSGRFAYFSACSTRNFRANSAFA